MATDFVCLFVFFYFVTDKIMSVFAMVIVEHFNDIDFIF